MNSTYTEELRHDIADDDAIFVKTFTDTGYKITVETDGLSFFGTKTGRELVKNLQHEMQEEIDREIIEKLKRLKEGYGEE